MAGLIPRKEVGLVERALPGRPLERSSRRAQNVDTLGFPIAVDMNGNEHPDAVEVSVFLFLLRPGACPVSPRRSSYPGSARSSSPRFACVSVTAVKLVPLDAVTPPA